MEQNCCGKDEPAVTKESSKVSDRHMVDYEPSVWGEYFITHPRLPHPHEKSEEWMKERRDELIEQVRGILKDALKNSLQLMKLIDAIERLGIGYHFQEEITQSMRALNDISIAESDFLAISLRFRLLRQHLYNVPCEVFGSFKDGEGNFVESLQRDVPALLNLYEAAYLAKPGEDFLSDAISFTTSTLRHQETHGLLPGPVSRRVKHALEMPLHRRMKRLEARLYIPIYQEDEGCDQVILELAKLDFHLLQLLHREEIRSLSLWYNQLGIQSKMSYARCRVGETYFWGLGVFDEPQYAAARVQWVQTIVLTSLLDDTFDSYGILEELQPFSLAIQQWNREAAKDLGECYKHYLTNILFPTFEEFENKGASKSGLSCLKECFKETSRCMVQETVWRDGEFVPLLKDHLSITLVTCMYWTLYCASLVGVSLEEKVSDATFEWVSSFPPIAKHLCVICRVMDDIVGHEFETGRKNVATAVTCYMKEHDVTIEEASNVLWGMIEDAWKGLNAEFLTLTSVPNSQLMPIVNLARMMETIYRKSDYYTYCSKLQDKISLLLDQPVPF